jgi:hypothetical protein
METTTPTVLKTSIATYILLYSGSFNPASPATGLLDCNDGGSDGYLSKLTKNLSAGGYEIVVTTYVANNITGTTTLDEKNTALPKEWRQ